MRYIIVDAFDRTKGPGDFLNAFAAGSALSVHLLIFLCCTLKSVKLDPGRHRGTEALLTGTRAKARAMERPS